MDDGRSDDHTGPVHAAPRSTDLDADVVVLRWPDEADLRADLALDQVRRLLVLDHGSAPPLAWGDGEDWVRSDADAVEVAARVERLAATPAGPAMPVLDGDGILRCPRGRWLSVPPVEARILAALLHVPGQAVRRRDLHRAAWGDAPVAERAVDGRIRSLRPRLRPLDLAIYTVRGVGYMLHTRPAADR